jgi:hypothetical protein
MRPGQNIEALRQHGIPVSDAAPHVDQPKEEQPTYGAFAPKRDGSPSEEVQQAEHAALVARGIADRKKQTEKDAADHLASANSRPSNTGQSSNQNIYLRKDV